MGQAFGDARASEQGGSKDLRLFIPIGTFEELPAGYAVTGRARHHVVFRHWPWIAGTLALVVAVPAAALTSGIAGFSGQLAISQGTPLYCSNTGSTGCHASDSSTKPPVVRFEGPTQVDPGAQATYTFVVTSRNLQVQIAAGLDVSASGGTLGALPDQQEQVCSVSRQPNGLIVPCPNLTTTPITTGAEITHTGPKVNDPNGEAAWQFTWTAPATAGVYVLFGAGNSVDFSTTDAGDEAAITTLMVTVGNPAPTATATSAPTPTPTRPPCAGDCNGDGMVRINELVLAVDIALGSSPAADCRAVDTDGSNSVSVNELVAAVNRALNGC